MRVNHSQPIVVNWSLYWLSNIGKWYTYVAHAEWLNCYMSGIWPVFQINYMVSRDAVCIQFAESEFNPNPSL